MEWELESEQENFQCPKCKSNYFGSSSKEGFLTRHCHDQHNRRCSFEWPETDDDKYRRLTKVYKLIGEKK